MARTGYWEYSEWFLEWYGRYHDRLISMPLECLLLDKKGAEIEHPCYTTATGEREKVYLDLVELKNSYEFCFGYQIRWMVENDMPPLRFRSIALYSEHTGKRLVGMDHPKVMTVNPGGSVYLREGQSVVSSDKHIMSAIRRAYDTIKELTAKVDG